MDDRIWQLVSKKLANEASEEELSELAALVAGHQEIRDRLKNLYQWWNDGSQTIADEQMRWTLLRLKLKLKDTAFADRQ